MKLLKTIIKMTVVGVVLFALSACDKNNADNTDTAVPTQATQQSTPSDGASTPNDHAANPVAEQNDDGTNNAQTATPAQSSGVATGDTYNGANSGNGQNNTATNEDSSQNHTQSGNTNTGSSNDGNGTNTGGGNSGTTANGGDGNNTTSGGNDHSTPALKTLTLSIDTATLNKDTNTTLNVQAAYSDKSTKDVTNQVQWMIAPKDAVKIEGTTLTTLKDGNVTVQATLDGKTSNSVTLDIYWEVNGHRLPPEPDPVKNNATLLGIDSNNNGVRDDVERWIYKTYSHPIERGIFMQSARAYNSLLSTQPIRHKENDKMVKLLACEYFWEDNDTYIAKKYEYKYFSTDIKKIQFNTYERLIAHHRYEKALSGGVYSVPKADKNSCEFDENGILKAEK